MSADISPEPTLTFSAAGRWWGVAGVSAAANQWLCYRNEYKSGGNSDELATAHIACDSKYWLWVNGRLVVFEGGLKRGPTPTSTYCDTVDLTPYLRLGTNTIAVLVWYWGKHGFSHNDSGKPGLYFDFSGAEGTWRARRHPAFGDTPAPHPNFRLAEPNICFDARLDDGDWAMPEFDDKAWSDAVELGHAHNAPWGELQARPIPQWRDSGLVDYPGEVPHPSRGGEKAVVAKLPYNAQVTPYFKVKAPAGCEIEVCTDAYDNFPNGPSVRGVYITRAGEQEFEFPGWMSGHAVHYQVPPEVEILELKYRETGYDADFLGSFECSDVALNELWRRSRRTLYVTMRDSYMDCPDRERAQWWGDVVNQMGQAFYALDSHRGAMLARKGIRELVAWKKPDGVLYSPIPAGRPTTFGQVIAGKLEQDGTWDRELPMQMLASLGWYGFWTYYWYSGDAKTVVAAYPAVKRYLMLWSLNERGRVAHRAGGWDWPDWGQNADVPILDTAWYYLALKAAVEMARLSGEESDRAGYESQMARISAIFDSEFWQGSAYRTDAVEKGPDDRANALAVVAGLVPPERFEAVQRVLAESRFAGPYMEKYVLEALFLMGAPEAALDRMRHRYARMLADPITTLWENFGGGEDRTGRGTYNHSWSGGPLTLLSQYVAGVAPLDPGWARVSIAPQPGALEWVRCTVPTVRGGVGVEMKSSALGLSFKLTLPPGCDGEFFLPDPSEGKVWQVVQVGGKVLSEALDSLILEEGVHHIDCLW